MKLQITSELNFNYESASSGGGETSDIKTGFFSKARQFLFFALLLAAFIPFLITYHANHLLLEQARELRMQNSQSQVNYQQLTVQNQMLRDLVLEKQSQIPNDKCDGEEPDDESVAEIEELPPDATSNL